MVGERASAAGAVTSETASAAVRLFKQFAGVQVDFGGLLRDSPAIRLVVRGAVAGLDVTDLSPLPGPFRIEVCPDADGSCRFRLPRQLDDSLVMEWIKESYHLVASKLPKKHPLRV